MTSVKQWGTAVVVAALAAVGAVAAPPASAAPTVPAQAIINDPNAANGTVSFFNSAGDQVSSGNNLNHLFDYAYASSPATRAKSTKATLYFSFPDHTQSDSQNWIEQQASPASLYPNSGSTTPASVKGMPNPLVSLVSEDANYNALSAGATLDTTSGYAGIVQVRVYDSGPGVPRTPPFWASDIYVDTVGGTWQQVYPAVSGPVATATSLTASPSSTTTGKAVTLTAKVTPVTAAGTVQFSEASKNFGSPVTVSNGVASITTGALAAGNHSFAAAFTPTSSADFVGSSGTTSVAVTTPKPDTTSLSISKNVTVTYGKTTKITGTLKDTKTNKAIGSAAVTIYVRHSTTAKWIKSTTVHSAANGAVALTVQPASKSYYEWHYAGTTSYAAATSKTATVAVKQTATIHATPAKITHGRSTKLWGSVAPSASGRKVTLQHKVGKAYKTVTSVKTKKQRLPNGKTAVGYVVTVKLAKKGSYTYRVVVAATSTLVSGTSAAVTVRAV